MAVAVRGTSTNGGTGTVNVTLPTGSAAGDWVIFLAINSGSTTITLGPNVTSLFNAVMGTGQAAIGTKQLDSTDITNGYLQQTSSANSSRCAILGFTGSDGFGTLGTVTQRSGSSTSSTALAVTASSGQKVLAIRLEKSTSNPGPVSVSPTTTQLFAYYTNATAAPSIYAGWYDGPGADRTFTDSVASGNALGVQITLIDSVVIPGNDTVSVWDGTSEVTGCSVSVWDGASEIAISASGLSIT